MKFQEIIKILGIRTLLKIFKNDLQAIRKYLVIELDKKPNEDISRYMRDIKKIMKIDFDIECKLYKENVLEVINKIDSQKMVDNESTKVLHEK